METTKKKYPAHTKFFAIGGGTAGLLAADWMFNAKPLVNSPAMVAALSLIAVAALAVGFYLVRRARPGEQPKVSV